MGLKGHADDDDARAIQEGQVLTERLQLRKQSQTGRTGGTHLVPPWRGLAAAAGPPGTDGQTTTA